VSPLWTATAAAAATGGWNTADWAANGVSIDSRTVAPGDLFVALRGPVNDGHDFVAAALAGGAAAAVVDRETVGLPAGAALLHVADTFVALNALGGGARARSGARLVAITGSVGKTGTKEALRQALAASRPTFASSGNLNNQWGVPLSLARLPRDAAYGVFELGMNHAGEIAGLARLVRPHVSVITTVEPVHLGFFPSVEAIADAKAEIFLGLEPGGVAVLNRDNPHFTRLAAAARRAGAAGVIGFGAHPEAGVRLLDCLCEPEGSRFTAALGGTVLRCRLALPGRHWVANALAVLGAAAAVGANPEATVAALAEFEAPSGRGHRHRLAWHGGTLTLIDESYNASPPSMAAALSVLGATPPAPGGRRIAVLGDMLELGAATAALHRDLARPLAMAGVQRVFLVGRAMAALGEALPAPLLAGLWSTAEAALPALSAYLRPGDVVMVKGSHAAHLDRIVERLGATPKPREI
jgi:UDP-N-acetylmuramoyl-tripeptide--D-alanyl-D-alanine ligase